MAADEGSKKELIAAWDWREKQGLFKSTEALRVFHGPGEGTGALKHWAIDRFGEHYWITRWESKSGREETGAEQATLADFEGFLISKGARSAVWLGRPEKGVPALPRVLLGSPPAGRFEVREGTARFWIQLLEARHPGLFLDHAPLRQWLGANARGWRVLNTFAYTGSLSIAAGLGGAGQVTTLDLSKPTIQWAEENWRLNELPAEKSRFIYGDVFEWLPRLKREGAVFDCVILDPPSFSRGKKGTFSTAKDLMRLHELAFGLLAERGVLATSINSANVTWAKYESEIAAAARTQRFALEVLRKIELPATFRTLPSSPEDRYLKGWVFRAKEMA